MKKFGVLGEVFSIGQPLLVCMRISHLKRCFQLQACYYTGRRSRMAISLWSADFVFLFFCFFVSLLFPCCCADLFRIRLKLEGFCTLHSCLIHRNRQ
ncbi:hypothetical protein F4808DRAFT_438699 [Astrocystis sublimbata]|nr:hypothetical protein F4808DRAFT_438699 [Astrocystis sublimbata]